MPILAAQPPSMGATEHNSYGNVLIAGTCLFGVVAFLGLGLFLFLSTINYEPVAGDDPRVAKRKERRVQQRLMVMFGTAANGILAAGYLFVLFKIGTLTRSDSYVINWSYFAFAAGAWFMLGLLHSVFFRLEGYARRVALAVLFALPPLLLALGPLSPSESKRDVCYGFAVALQFVSVAYIAWFEGVSGPLKRAYGIIPAGLVLVAFLLYDVFWFIGFLNEDNSAVVLTSRWNAQIAFLFADLLAMIGSAAAAIMLYRPLRLGAAMPTVEAGFAAGPDGTALYADVDGASMKF